MVKHDLPLPTANSNLHRRCDYRKDEYEDMTNAEMFWKTFGLRQKNPDEPIVLDKIWLEGKYIKPLGDSVIGIVDIGSFIQHVGYDEEQCGRTK